MVREAIEARECKLALSAALLARSQADRALILQGQISPAGACTYETLLEAVRQTVAAFTAADATAWFGHAGHLLPAQTS